MTRDRHRLNDFRALEQQETTNTETSRYHRLAIKCCERRTQPELGRLSRPELDELGLDPELSYDLRRQVRPSTRARPTASALYTRQSLHPQIALIVGGFAVRSYHPNHTFCPKCQPHLFFAKIAVPQTRHFRHSLPHPIMVVV